MTPTTSVCRAYCMAASYRRRPRLWPTRVVAALAKAWPTMKLRVWMLEQIWWVA